MTESIQEFILDSLRAMNYDTEGITSETELGPRGADLESLALAELAVRVEDAYHVKFSEDEAEDLAGLTVAEFCALVTSRVAAAPAAGQ